MKKLYFYEKSEYQAKIKKKRELNKNKNNREK